MSIHPTQSGRSSCNTANAKIDSAVQQTNERKSNVADPSVENRILAIAKTLERELAELASDSKVTCRVLKSVDEFQAIKQEWNRFRVDPMSSFDWNFSWWKAFGSKGQLQLVQFERDGTTIGFAPFYIDRWLGMKRFRFIASGDTCTDYADIICAPLHHDLCAFSLAEHIRDEAYDVVELECTKHDQVATLLKQHLDSAYRCDHREAEPCWKLSLPESWQEFKANSKSSLRRKINRAERNLASSEYELKSTSSGLPVDRAFKILKELHTKRWASLGKKGIFDDPMIDQFLQSAVNELSIGGGTEIAVASKNSVPIGAQLYFDSSEGYQFYQSGYCPDAMRLEPGHMLFTNMVKRAIERGDKCFDFLRGNESYKAFWGAQPHSQKKLRMTSKRMLPTLIANIAAQARNLLRPNAITGG